MNIQNAVVLVTGANRGIGLEIARAALQAALACAWKFWLV